MAVETQKKKLSFWEPHCGFHLQECLDWCADKAYYAKPKTTISKEPQEDISLGVWAADLVVLKSTRQLDIPAIFRIACGLLTIASHFQSKLFVKLIPVAQSWNKRQFNMSIQTLAKWGGTIRTCHPFCRPSSSEVGRHIMPLHCSTCQKEELLKYAVIYDQVFNLYSSHTTVFKYFSIWIAAQKWLTWWYFCRQTEPAPHR